MKRLLLLLLKGYQWFVRPILPPTCRFHPSCSQYSYEAIAKYGVFKGFWFTIKRVARCNPWHRGGFDPVP